jgi:hypothetical protein
MVFHTVQSLSIPSAPSYARSRITIDNPYKVRGALGFIAPVHGDECFEKGQKNEQMRHTKAGYLN